jgi:hypothetical protein
MCVPGGGDGRQGQDGNPQRTSVVIRGALTVLLDRAVRSQTASRYTNACLAVAFVVLAVVACATPAPSLPPMSSPAPATAPEITPRPTAPAGLEVTGADAPRNVPDPCALVMMAEVEQLIGAAPEVAVRGFRSSEDSWTCEIQAVSGIDGRVFVAIYVNAAHSGWTEPLIAEPGATALTHPSLVGVGLGEGGVAVELDHHVLVLGASRADGEPVQLATLTAAAGLIVERLVPPKSGGQDGSGRRWPHLAARTQRG